MNIAEATNLALWLGNLSACYATQVTAVVLELLIPLGCKLGLQTSGFTPQLIHYALGIRTKL